MTRTVRLRVLCLLVCAALAVMAPLAAGSAAGAAGLSQLEIVRAGGHAGSDRVVFEFIGPVPRSRVEYVDRIYSDPSGARLPVPGRALLKVTLRDAVAHDDHGPRASRRNTFTLPNVMSALQAGDSEGVVTYGIGLAARRSFHTFTLTNPSRLVIDIRADFPTVYKRLYFSGATPDGDIAITPVLRRVRPLTPASGLMDRLFAGPTPQEAELGLLPPRFPSLTARSGATGFTRLSIQDGIARVQLTGGCSSGGSTVTVANEIMPTLRQFASVDYVKIYDPSGRTERPTGRSDSIPECLEP